MKSARSAPKPELSRPIAVDRIKKVGSHEKVEADATERLALAKRFGVPEVHVVRADLFAKPWRGGGVKVTGDVYCEMDRLSVVSLEAFRHAETFTVERYFLPAHDLDPDDDADPIEEGEIDLGEVVAETIALEMEPYPRRAGEEFRGPETPPGMEN